MTSETAPAHLRHTFRACVNGPHMGTIQIGDVPEPLHPTDIVRRMRDAG